jgi:hypothetical protein
MANLLIEIVGSCLNLAFKASRKISSHFKPLPPLPDFV